MLAGSSTERSRANVGNSGKSPASSVFRRKVERSQVIVHLALGQFKGHRRIRQGLDDVGEHLAGNDNLPLLVHAGRDAMADRDSVVGRLELKDPVGGTHEHAGEDGERR